MKKLSTNEIRRLWLEYFEKQGHEIVASSSLVPGNDPTLMFTNAGMVQFKDVFLGLEKRPYSRATTAQKCLRVSGKHNDLEEVGPSPRHHTFFEMLGNFSFGDYFKKEAIEFAWDLLINVLGLPLERLWFTVYTDDDEAESLWQAVGAPRDRILRFGKKDNWWSMGDVGPCGPCSEIHYYWGDLEKQTASGVNVDDEYLEIWNLVFMQFDAKADGELVPLPKPSVDTGAGLERLASILQGKDNNYDTDAFTPVMDKIQSMLGHTDEERQEHLVGYRVIADHSRAVTFLINDGVLPGNEGRNYVTRMILRRAARYGKIIGFRQPFLADIADVVIDEMGQHYTELLPQRDFIRGAIHAEEERFQRALNVGLSILDELIETLKDEGKTVIPGEEAFRLWDTYGFPVDITRDVAREHGMTVDEAGYRRTMEAAKERARASAGKAIAEEDASVYVQLLEQLKKQGELPEAGVRHLIYENVDNVDTKVIGLIKDGQIVEEAQPGDEIEIVLPETPFYVESGGQVSDTGEMYYFPEDLDEPVWLVNITDTRRPVAGLIVHVGTVVSGTVKTGDPVHAEIDTDRRWDIMRHHTATHVLHAELRNRLGKHVRQYGSLVAPDRLRFDFTHPRPLTKEELEDIERLANEVILANYPVGTRWTSYDQAVKEGALAFFSEKYGDTVRVVTIGDQEETVSMELCGGTHVDSTAEIGSLRVVSESSVAAGVRRIEAVSGRPAEELIEQRLDLLERVADMLRTRPDEVDRAVSQLQEQHQKLQKELAQLREKLAKQEAEALINQAVDVNGVSVLAVQVDVDDVDTLRQMTDWFRDKLGSSVVVLGAAVNGKPMLVAAATQDVIRRGIHAGNLVRDVARIVGGGGGGRPNMAQAGGSDVGKLPDALAAVVPWVEQHLQD
jgi:alanyl-tRNA synthetase